MKHYQVICQSVRGESHIQRGTPKEDAAEVKRFDDRVIGAVSDGHGDPRCMRSQIGSQLAVDVAMELLRDWNPEGSRDDQEPFDARVNALARDIVERWNRAIEAHFSENPLTEAELKDAGNLAPSYRQGKHISHIYGATLIALVRMKDSLFLLQKGDGHAVVIDRQGAVSDQVIPWDDRCYLNVTTSLCDSDAADSFTWRLLQGDEVEDIAAVMLGSDGVEDSFANSDLMGAYYGLLAVECVENGESATEAAMLNDLAEMSRYGSKDDISVVGLIDPEAMPPLKPIFERMQKRGALALKLESTTARLNSMSAAYARREQQLQAKRQALEAYLRASAEIAGKQDAQDDRRSMTDRFRLGKLRHDLESLQREIDRRNAEEARLRKRVSAATADYDKYNRELSAARLEMTRLIDRCENPGSDPLSMIQREYAFWELENCKDRLDYLNDAFSEQEHTLQRTEQDLDKWQKDTQSLEQHRKKLSDELEGYKVSQHAAVEQQRRHVEAELEQRNEEENRLKRELSDIEADFEDYGKKYDAAVSDRDQLVQEIEKLK